MTKSSPSSIARAIKWQKDHPEKTLKIRRRYIRNLRLEIINHYGGKCKCCGETSKEFLAIDHINGCGTKQRKKIGGGVNFYNWIKRNNFPNTLRVLCHNCNQSLGFYGYCPHQNKKNIML